MTVPPRPWARRSVYDREILALGLPALGALIADPLLSLVDTAFVGRIGSDELAALGVSAAVFAVAFFAFNFLEYGTTSLVARAVGGSDIDRAARATTTALTLALVLGVVGALLLELFIESIVGVMGAKGAVADSAETYIRIRALATPAVLFIRVGHGVFRGFQDTRTPFVVTAGLNGVNLVLDPLLMFGFGLGIGGAAWATVTAQWLGAIVFLGLLVSGRRSTAGLRIGRPRRDELREFLRLGRDLTIRTGALLAFFTLSTAIAARISPSAVAAHQVVGQWWLFTALALDAVAIAAQAMVGRRVGAGDRADWTAASDRLAMLGVVVGVGFAVVLAALAPFIPVWFTDDPAVRDSIRSIYPFLVLMQPLNGLVFVWDGVFMGVGDFAYLAAAMVGASLVATVLLLLVLPLGWGLAAVWWANIMLMTARALTLAWRRAARGGPLRLR